MVSSRSRHPLFAVVVLAPPISAPFTELYGSLCLERPPPARRAVALHRRFGARFPGTSLTEVASLPSPAACRARGGAARVFRWRSGAAPPPCPHRWAPTPTTGRTGRTRWARGRGRARPCGLPLPGGCRGGGPDKAVRRRLRRRSGPGGQRGGNREGAAAAPRDRRTGRPALFSPLSAGAWGVRELGRPYGSCGGWSGPVGPRSLVLRPLLGGHSADNRCRGTLGAVSAAAVRSLDSWCLQRMLLVGLFVSILLQTGIADRSWVYHNMGLGSWLVALPGARFEWVFLCFLSGPISLAQFSVIWMLLWW